MSPYATPRNLLQHYLNPLHVYCKLRAFGVRASLATRLCRFYERCVYKGVLPSR